MSLWGAIGSIAGSFLGPAGTAIGGALGGAIDGNKASKGAINAQQDAANQANALQKQMFDTTREDQRPYREAGYGALEQIQNLLKNPGNVTQDPGYQFGLDQGARALNSGAAARGMTYSGAQGKALTRYGQDYAGTKLDQSYNRLSNLAGLGQVGVNGQNNQNYGNNVGNTLQNLGNAQAGASMYNGRNWMNAGNQIAAQWGQGGNSSGGINLGGGGLGGFSISDLLGGKGLGGGL